MNKENKNKMSAHGRDLAYGGKVLGSIAAIVGIFIFSVNVAFASEITPENIVSAVNKEREVRNIQPLKVNSKLQNAAGNKSTDMIVRNYFEHYAYGLTPWQFIANQNYDYSVAGENLAMGFSSSEGVVNAWMNSPAHRANLLNSEFEEVGVGVVKGEYTENGNPTYTTMTTEMLAKPEPKISQILFAISKKIINIFK